MHMSISLLSRIVIAIVVLVGATVAIVLTIAVGFVTVRTSAYSYHHDDCCSFPQIACARQGCTVS